MYGAGQHIGKIYSQATRVVIWVGREQIQATEMIENVEPLATNFWGKGWNGYPDDDVLDILLTWWGMKAINRLGEIWATVQPWMPYHDMLEGYLSVHTGIICGSFKKSYWQERFWSTAVADGTDTLQTLLDDINIATRSGVKEKAIGRLSSESLDLWNAHKIRIFVTSFRFLAFAISCMEVGHLVR